ncbi:MAG: hypothetical protein H7296_05810 [Bacteroidia bacterium]|nr:hypothetical protein [Bacteroidia bacterium]
MKVTIDNYEVLLIDYLDGVLDPLLADELLTFINNNEALKAELDILPGVQQLNENETDAEKIDFSFLKKPASVQLTQQLEELMIGAVEKQLSADQELSLKRSLLLYPELKPHFELFNHTKLLPEPAIVFDNKQQLKKKSQAKIIPLFTKIIAVAAVFLFFGFATVVYFNLQKVNVGSNSELASNIPAEKLKTEPVKSLVVAKQTEMLQVSPVHIGKNKYKKTRVQINQMFASEEVIEIDAKQLNSINDNRVAAPLLTPAIPRYNNEILNRTMARNEHFFTPKEWLLEKFKEKVPQSEYLVDTLFNGGAKAAAIQLLNNTTGIAYTVKITPYGSHKRFSIVSKYFAFERTPRSDY